MAPRSRRLLAAFGDDRLVEQVRRGNDAAFEAVYDRHHRGILAFCRHMLGSQEEAEDAVQQSFAAAYTDLRKDDRAIRLKAWLYTIARNRCLSILRARREQPAELDDEKLATAGLVESVQQRAELRELLHDLGRLPDDQREALVLFEIGDLSHKEIGDVLGVPAVKVKALVFQARSALIEQRDARAIPCAEIREQLATASGGALRRGPLRRHLKSCSGCSEYRDQVKAQRRALAALIPGRPVRRPQGGRARGRRQSRASPAAPRAEPACSAASARRSSRSAPPRSPRPSPRAASPSAITTITTRTRPSRRPRSTRPRPRR